MMKIVYILPHLGCIAPNTVMINIMRYLKADIHVVSLAKSPQDNYRPLLESLHIPIYETKNLFTIAKITKNAIIHASGYRPNIIAAVMARCNSVKVIATCHSNERIETQVLEFKGITLLKAKIKHCLQPLLYRSFSCVVGVSHDIVSNYLHPIGVKRCVVIYNGIEPLTVTTSKKDAFSCIFAQVGHIMPLKNQRYSIELIAYLRKQGIDASLWIFGAKRDSEYVAQLEALIVSENLQNHVLFFGHLDSQSLFAKMQQAHICIIPSLIEGLPLALLEAMSLGLGCIVSQYGGMKEIVTNGENGVVIVLEDPKSFEAVASYVQTKQFLAHSQASQKKIVQNYSAKKMSKQYKELYENTHLC